MAQAIDSELNSIARQMRGLGIFPSPPIGTISATPFGGLEKVPNRDFGHTYRGPFLGVIPNCVPGKLASTDFIHFAAPFDFPYRDYCVWVETINNNRGLYHGGAYFKNLGKMNAWGLNKDYTVTLQLPDVHIGPHAKLFVIPDTEVMSSGKPYPRFIGTLRRGATYHITDFMFSSAMTNPNSFVPLSASGSVM